MAHLTIVANIVAKPDKVDLVKQELLNLIEFTRQEEGCVNYDLHQDNSNPAHFLFFENWTNRELWQQHMANSHIEKYLAATEGAVESFVVNEMTHIG
ncbi:antibiotic biosynthesis monooxygenase [Vibrio ponticus]|uniref:Antibiotic biosynthesis monooxygenase n=1 Tax=Vibrio ponticus TaxID=265668 RepID=A0ABX3FBP6_9VIBR|nr:putative quinol monooxygenase [Vibrio ponticus]OLQ89048.1 antibiotic biosynthesis monooxygenase [Vibrio ponticus]